MRTASLNIIISDLKVFGRTKSDYTRSIYSAPTARRIYSTRDVRLHCNQDPLSPRKIIPYVNVVDLKLDLVIVAPVRFFTD